MALYRTGTAAMDAQGVITGTGTKWREPLTLIRTGATIVFLTTPLKLAVISDIVSDTEMKAIQTDGEPVANGNYVILLNDSLTVDGMAQDVAETLRYYQSKETEIAGAMDIIANLDMDNLNHIVEEVKANRLAAEAARNQSDSSAQAAAASAAEANTTKGQVQQIVDGSVASINAAKDQAVTDISAKESAVITHIDTEEAAAIQAINDAKGDLSVLVNDAQTAAATATAAKNDSQAARNESVSAKDAAAQSAQEAKDAAASVDAGNLLHKDNNLSDLANKEEARNQLSLGRAQNATFGGVYSDQPDSGQGGGIIASRRTASASAVSTEARFYHEFQDGKSKATIHVSNGNKNRHIKIDEDGRFVGVGSAQVGNLISSGLITAGVKSLVNNAGGGGGNRELSMNVPAGGDTSVGSWVNLVQGNWYDGYWQIGGVRGPGTDLDHFKIGVNNQGTDWNEFRFYNSFGGHIVAQKGFRGQCSQGGWGIEGGYMGSPFDAGVTTGNDGSWSPIVTGGSISTGGYQLHSSFGTMPTGNAAWPRTVIKMLGDGNYHRGFEFFIDGEITTWGHGNDSWLGNYVFQKAASSDRDIKHDIEYTEGRESYDRVMQWLPTMFKYNGSEIQRYGLIAQDLMKVDPQYVKLVPGAPKLLEVTRYDEEKGCEVFDRHIDTGDFYDDTLALDTNVMITDMACAMVYMGNKMEEMEERLKKIESMLSK